MISWTNLLGDLFDDGRTGRVDQLIAHHQHHVVRGQARGGDPLQRIKFFFLNTFTQYFLHRLSLVKPSYIQ